jgi:hypothetical protein
VEVNQLIEKMGEETKLHSLKPLRISGKED